MVSTFPVCQKILKILARLPICVSTAERVLPPNCVSEDLAYIDECAGKMKWASVRTE